jgi:tetraacyldisaccharide 4'-kinase
MRRPEFWSGHGLAAHLLAPLGRLYGRSVAFKARHARPYRSRAKVVCVGNLTAGGSGKTPVAIALAKILAAKGKKVFFLTRGYGGKEKGPALVKPFHTARQMGDEALLLARTAPTIVARDRAAGAAFAETLGAEIVVMDDGHQNFALAKDLSLVVMDGAGFGNGLMIPAGPLREPLAQGLARADAVVVMGESPDLGAFRGPVLRARLKPEADDLRGQTFFAFAGIGRPAKFVESLRVSGIRVTGSRFFPDHYPYRPEDIAALKRRGALITTEKDYVRLGEEEREGIAILPVAVQFEDDPTPLLDRLLRPV